MDFYDGTKLLSLKDINGNKPEIYIVTSNRSAGKTTFFERMLTNNFKKRGEKFMLLYRYNYELDDCAEKFFKDINGLFFKGDVLQSRRRASGIFHELFLNDKSCGYAVSINSAEVLKRYSHMFSDTSTMFFDEFQSENNKYCSREIEKLLSIHTSVARGQSKQVRYVPLIMCSNPVSIINPYYAALGISARLRENTKFLKGDGFVLEQGFNNTASLAQKESAFNRAFSTSQYVQYSAEAVYLNDNKSFIERITGKHRYLCTLCYNGKHYSIKEYVDEGIIYCDDKADLDFPTKIAVTTDDFKINYIMLKKNSTLISALKIYFERGLFRFKNLSCKECIFNLLSYS